MRNRSSWKSPPSWTIATKAQLKDLLAQARTAATQAEAAQKNTEQYRSWIDSAANDLENARSQLKKSPEGFDFDQAESWDLSQLVTKSALLNKRLEDARNAAHPSSGRAGTSFHSNRGDLERDRRRSCGIGNR